MKTFRKTLILLVLTITAFNFAQTAFAHCQIPCGIYDDYARLQSMIEDSATVEKSMKLINELAGKSD